MKIFGRLGLMGGIIWRRTPCDKCTNERTHKGKSRYPINDIQSFSYKFN